jgi:hypothetical protein
MPKGIAVFTAALQSFSVSTAAWVILTVLVMLRLRRLAGVAATGLLAWFAVSFYVAGGWGYVEPQTMKVVAALALEAVALLASPGPRRGLQIMTRKHWALAVIAPAAVESVWLWRSHPAAPEAVAIAVITVILSGMMLASPLSKRLGILLSVFAYYVVVGLFVPPLLATGGGGTVVSWDGTLRITLSLLPFAVILGVLLAAALRSGRRAPAGGREA